MGKNLAGLVVALYVFTSATSAWAQTQGQGARNRQIPSMAFTDRCKDTARLTTTEREYCAQQVRVVQNQFTTTRGLDNYVATFGPGFEAKLRAIGAGKQWVDLGSGESYALEDYFITQCHARSPTERASVNSRGFNSYAGCAPLSPEAIQTRARATGITVRLTRSVPSFNGKLRVLKDRFFSEIPDSEIGQIDLATDLYGVLSYTRTLDEDLAKVLRLLSPDGSLYVYGNLTDRENVVEVPGQGTMTVETWLRSISGLEVVTHSGSSGPVLTIKKKLGVKIEIPKLTLKGTNDGAPPRRTFALAQGSHLVQAGRNSTARNLASSPGARQGTPPSPVVVTGAGRGDKPD